MRGALQARSSRLPGSMPGLGWSVRIPVLRRPRRRPTPERLEAIAHIHRQRQIALREGMRSLDLGRQWLRRL
jgi:hypothetical protein